MSCHAKNIYILLPSFLHSFIYVYFVVCLIVYFYINNIFIEISCFVVPFIDYLICFWLTRGIKRWIRKCRQNVNPWNPTKVKSWCGADTEMQGDSTSDQYGCLIDSWHRSDIEPCCTSDIGPTLQCRHSVANWCRTEVKKPMSGLHGNARRLDIGPIWFFDMQPTSVRHRVVLHIRCRTDVKADVGPM